MRPTVSWMKEKYKIFRQQLFSEYEMPEIPVDRFSTKKTRDEVQMKLFNKDNPIGYQTYSYGNDDDYDNPETWVNFQIALNTRYRDDEHGFETTLVHEMCHLACDYNGLPQGKTFHEAEWAKLAKKITKKSNGYYKIEQYADLKQDYQATSNNRKERMNALAERDGYYVVLLSNFPKDDSKRLHYINGKNNVAMSVVAIPIVQRNLAEKCYDFYCSEQGMDDFMKNSKPTTLYSKVFLYHVDPEHSFWTNNLFKEQTVADFSKQGLQSSVYLIHYLNQDIKSPERASKIINSEQVLTATEQDEIIQEYEKENK